MAINLKEQAGPLPVGAWIAVVGGGLIVSYLGRKHKSASIPAAPVPIDSAPISGYRPAIQEQSTNVPNSAVYKTNDEWAKGAINALVGHGYDPTVATNAVNFYLYPSGDHSLTLQESAAIGAAILYVGSPPSLPSTFIGKAPDTPAITPVTPNLPPAITPVTTPPKRMLDVVTRQWRRGAEMLQFTGVDGTINFTPDWMKSGILASGQLEAPTNLVTHTWRRGTEAITMTAPEGSINLSPDWIKS